MYAVIVTTYFFFFPFLKNGDYDSTPRAGKVPPHPNMYT